MTDPPSYDERRIEQEILVETAAVLTSLAQEFIDITTVATPAGVKLFKHGLTGRTLRVTAEWLEP